MKKLIPHLSCQTAPKFVRNAVVEFKELRTLVEQAVCRMTLPQRVKNRPRMRIFSSNGTRDDFLTRFLTTSLNSKKSLEKHLDKLWPEGYCIAVNDISCWSPLLQDYVVDNFVKNWISIFGVSVGGIDIYAFIGRYDKTPFGIHKDDEDSYLFNLGPSTKTVRLWSRDSLVEEFGADALNLPVFEYKSNNGLFEKFELNPGDAIFIPKGIYHILESPEYSVMLGIAPYLGSNVNIIQSAMSRLLKPIINDIKFIDYGDDQSRLNLLVDDFTSVMSGISNFDLRQSINAEMMLLESNNFIRGSFITGDECFDVNKDYSILKNYVPIKLEFRERLYLFCRGHELSFGNIKLVEKVLATMQDMPKFSATAVYDKLNGEVSQNAITKLLIVLFDCGCIFEHEIH